MYLNFISLNKFRRVRSELEELRKLHVTHEKYGNFMISSSIDKDDPYYMIIIGIDVYSEFRNIII